MDPEFILAALPGLFVFCLIVGFSVAGLIALARRLGVWGLIGLIVLIALIAETRS